MNKKILIVSIILILAAVIFASCGKKEKDDNNTTASNTQVNTIATIDEYSTSESGEMYITNVDGYEIPITKDSQGNVELVENLITKTPEQVSKEKEEIEENKTAASTSAVASTSAAAGSSSGGVSVGNEDPLLNDDNVAIIDWR